MIWTLKDYKYYLTTVSQNYMGKLSEVNKILMQRKIDKGKIVLIDVIPQDLYPKMKRFYPNNNLYYMDEDAQPYVYAQYGGKKFFLVEIIDDKGEK